MKSHRVTFLIRIGQSSLLPVVIRHCRCAFLSPEMCKSFCTVGQIAFHICHFLAMETTEGFVNFVSSNSSASPRYFVAMLATWPQVNCAHHRLLSFSHSHAVIEIATSPSRLMIHSRNPTMVKMSTISRSFIFHSPFNSASVGRRQKFHPDIKSSSVLDQDVLP